jgi:periplasmic divalent cation tolerance protein
MTHCCIIMTSTDKLEIATKISESLIKQKLAKCVHRDNIESVYEWNGEVVNSHEYRLMIKCKSSNAKAIMEYIKQEHNYTLPEIITINIDDGSEEYIKWLIH